VLEDNIKVNLKETDFDNMDRLNCLRIGLNFHVFCIRGFEHQLIVVIVFTVIIVLYNYKN
jgi:hypothetical protein